MYDDDLYDDDPDDFYDDEDDGWDDDPYDDDEDDSGDWEVCPHCQAEIFEDSVRCPVCGEYVTFGSSVWAGRSIVWVVLGLLGIAATIAALAFS